jgi:hypothetical protein
MTKRKALVAVSVVLFVVVLVAYTQITLFVIPPIGAVPEGRTVVMSRSAATHFVDSPDAVCERIQGGVSLLCRGVVMGQALNGATIYARLPYSRTLYLVSTGGKTYDR